VKPRRSWLLVVGVALVAVLVGGRWLALETAEAPGPTRSAAAISTSRPATVELRRVLAPRVVGRVGTTHLWWVYRAIGSVQMPRRLGDLEIVEAVPQRLLLLGTI